MKLEKLGKYAPLVYVGAAVVAAYVIYKVAQTIGGAAKAAVDAVAKPLADAYVRVTAGPVIQLADGITYVLPGGVRVLASKTTPVSGGFLYLGLKYKAVEATPPGSGVYRAERVI